MPKVKPALLTEEQLTAAAEKIKMENGVDEVVYLKGGGYEAICTVPTTAQHDRFQSQAMDDKRRSKAMENLFRACVKYPPMPQVEEMLAAKPGLCIPFGDQLLDACGTLVVADSKKL